jgi:hypothetical protein
MKINLNLPDDSEKKGVKNIDIRSTKREGLAVPVAEDLMVAMLMVMGEIGKKLDRILEIMEEDQEEWEELE